MTKEKSKEGINDPPKGDRSIDPQKYKFTLNIAAICALIFGVYQITDFVWKNYHEMEKRVHTIEIKYQTLESNFDLLEQKFETNLETSRNTKEQLQTIEGFIDGLKTDDNG